MTVEVGLTPPEEGSDYEAGFRASNHELEAITQPPTTDGQPSQAVLNQAEARRVLAVRSSIPFAPKGELHAIMILNSLGYGVGVIGIIIGNGGGIISGVVSATAGLIWLKNYNQRRRALSQFTPQQLELMNRGVDITESGPEPQT